MQTKLSPNGITAVLFDLDGTLRHNRPSYNQTLFDYAVQLGAPDSPERRRNALRWVHYYWAQSPEMLQDQETYGGLSDEFWSYYSCLTLINFGCPEAQAQALAPQVQQFMSNDYHPVDHVPPDAWETLESLREAGFPLGVASNRSKPYGEQMAALGLEPFFQFALAAGELNTWKPEPGIFLHAVELLGVQAGQTIYVGDNYFADILGAANAGLRPVLLDPEGLFPEAECPVIRSLGGAGRGCLVRNHRDNRRANSTKKEPNPHRQSRPNQRTGNVDQVVIQPMPAAQQCGLCAAGVQGMALGLLLAGRAAVDGLDAGAQPRVRTVNPPARPN